MARILYIFQSQIGVQAFQKAEVEFSKQMQISYHGIQELTSMAIGKGIEYGVSASVGNILSISDFMSKLAGFGYYVGKRSLDYSRSNPHTLVGTSVWSDEYTFKESALQDYVKYILYCYPNDLDEGYRGFRYGAESDKGDCGKLIKIKYFFLAARNDNSYRQRVLKFSEFSKIVFEFNTRYTSCFKKL